MKKSSKYAARGTFYLNFDEKAYPEGVLKAQIEGIHISPRPNPTRTSPLPKSGEDE